MHHSEEAKPTWLRLALLRKRWSISRTTLFTVQRRHIELQSEFPFGPGLPMVRLSAVEAFEQRTHNAGETDPVEKTSSTAQARRHAPAVSA